jgi:tRNA 2-selenouridine synthase
MGIEKIPVEQFVQLSQIHTVIDVRSDAEYAHAHIPGASSIPLFNDEERAVVGTIYKQQSREDAIKKGLDYFGPKMKRMLLEAEVFIKEKNSDNKTVLVHCWRGGMRSAAVAWLLDLYGFKVYTLIGGYKAFRNWVLVELGKHHPFQILGGNTGSGKTIVLHALKNLDEAVVDLEGIAGHKGSAFGNIGLPKQPSQEMFENKLSIAIKTEKDKYPNKKIWLEDESQRIGTVNIPQNMWEHMRRCDIVFLDIPFSKRLDYLVNTYGTLDWKALGDAILRIQKRLGGLETKTAMAALEEKNFHDCFDVLLKYYDKQYRKGLANREDPKPAILMVIAEGVNDVENAKLIINKRNGRN